MVKARASDIQRQIQNLDPKFRVVLIYGPDEGLVRERADIISRQVVDDLNDPFGVTCLVSEDVVDDPGRLSDELSSISMMGGRRLIRLDNATDKTAAALAIALDLQVDTENLLVVRAGNLTARSKIRKLMEAAQNGLTIPCYSDESANLKTLIHTAVEANRLTIAPDAMSFLVSRLGEDRMASRQELEKLILYMGDREDRVVSLTDVNAAVGDSSALALDSIAEAVTGGELVRLDGLVERALMQGENEVGLIRSLQRRLERLHLAKGLVEDGASPDQAMAKLWPAVFFKDKTAFRQQMSRWSRSRLLGAITVAREAEIACKTAGMPGEAIFFRTCFRIASAAVYSPSGK